MPELDMSMGRDDSKDFQNLQALSADGFIKEILSGSATWDPASILDGDETATDITVAGVALGDIVLGVSFSLDVTDLSLTADVTAANTVTAVLANNSGGTVDLVSGTARVLIADVT